MYSRKSVGPRMEPWGTTIFSLNTGISGPEITPYLDTFHAVNIYWANILSREDNEMISKLLN